MITRTIAVALVLATALAGCSSDDRPTTKPKVSVVVAPPDPNAPTHTHETTIGDGTTADAGGFSMTLLSFPDEVGQPADLTFRIDDSRGEPVLDYQVEQTKLLHLYVVRDDLTQFRHLHPTLADDGTWTARLDLAAPGRYRVVAEFVPTARPGGSHVVLAQRAVVDGAWEPDTTTPGPIATDGVVSVQAPPSVPTGTDERLTLTVSDGASGVVNLGTYLGAYAHLTGFDEESGAFVHAHPLGSPETTAAGSELTFHTSFAAPGRFRLFVQVRVDGFVHTLPLELQVV